LSGAGKTKGVFILHTLFEASEIGIGFEQKPNLAELISSERLPQASPVQIVNSCKERWTRADNFTL